MKIFAAGMSSWIIVLGWNSTFIPFKSKIHCFRREKKFKWISKISMNNMNKLKQFYLVQIWSNIYCNIKVYAPIRQQFRNFQIVCTKNYIKKHMKSTHGKYMRENMNEFMHWYFKTFKYQYLRLMYLLDR